MSQAGKILITPKRGMTAGQKFGRLTAVAFVDRDGRSQSRWRFLCDCGVEIVRLASQVKFQTRSCGCLHREHAAALGRRPRVKRPPRQPLTAERLRFLVAYNPESGIFIRLKGPTTGIGKPTGRRTLDGYRWVTVDGRSYAAARLAWMYMTDAWPTQEIDHINGDRGDNSWKNLREASRAENARNVRVNTDTLSGLKGAHWHKQRQKWQAAIGVNGRSVYLGLFDTAEAANAAYSEAAVKYFGEFACS